MKFSYQWLKDIIPGLKTVPADLERLITMKTAECEGIEEWQGGALLGRAEADWVIEIDNKSLTHRPDLWGHYGMAREVAAITGNPLNDPVNEALIPTAPGVELNVAIEDYSLCPRYSALVFDNVTIGPSPAWLQARLLAAGINPLNNIVDVTNYVLAEVPQPMHAFDADRLDGNTIKVRRASEGEELKALNGETYKLAGADLVIADRQGVVAIAGVIGGQYSAITETTKRIVLESANFQATSVRLTSARHKLRTDASMRFEKSLDPHNTTRGLARAIALLNEVSPGIRMVGGLADSHAPFSAPQTISLSAGFVSRRLGKPLDERDVRQILESLGFGVELTTDAMLAVTVPSWRATKDISIKDDLVEEVGRIVGYGEITPAPPLLAAVVPPSSASRLYHRAIRSGLAAQGFTEAYNYSFINETQWKPFGFEEEDHLRVANPIASELTHLRRSLLPGVLDTIAKNVKNFGDFRFFEIGRETHPKSGALPEEQTHVVTVLYGEHANERDFFELKRVAECVFPGVEMAAAESPQSWEHPFRTADMNCKGQRIGRLFELHPAVLESKKIEGRAFIFDADLGVSEQTARKITEYKPVRRYPTSAFDLSVVASLREPVANLECLLGQFGGKDVLSIEFVRQYAGPPLEAGQKSVSYRIEVGASDRTLTNEEVTAVRTAVIDGMRSSGYELRV